MKSKLIAATVGSLFAVAVQAAPIALQSGPLYFQFSNLEQAGPNDTSALGNVDLNGDNTNDLTAGSAEYNWGVFNLSSIAGGAVSVNHENIAQGFNYWTNDGSHGQVHGIFYGFQQTGATTLTGGYIDIYWTDSSDITASDMAGNFAPTNRTSWNQAGKFTQGTFLARLEYGTGILQDGSNTTVKSDNDPFGCSQTQGQCGTAEGYANVMDINNDGVIDSSDGAWAYSLDTDWFFVDPDGNGSIQTRDIRFANRYSYLPAWNGSQTIGLQSNDPGKGFVVPEPASLALMGLGLMGLGFSRRRKVS